VEASTEVERLRPSGPPMGAAKRKLVSSLNRRLKILTKQLGMMTKDTAQRYRVIHRALNLQEKRRRIAHRASLEARVSFVRPINQGLGSFAA